MRLLTIAVAVGVTALAGAAIAAKPSPLTTPPPAPGTGVAGGQCFRSQDIRNHTFADDKTLLLSVQGKGVYRVTVDGSCLVTAFQSDPIITRSPPGSTLICKPIDLDIGVLKGGNFESRCIVQSIVKMPPEEVAALPRKLKP